MENKKEEPYIMYNTKEDFDKWFNEVHSSGYDEGYRDGLARALGYILNCMDDNFDDEVLKDAKRESIHIGINNWRRKQVAVEEGIKKRAINEHIRKMKEESEQQG